MIALVIAAEAVAAAGRPSEARRLADRAIEATGEPLDALFAGMPRQRDLAGRRTGDGEVEAFVPDSVAVDSASPAAVDAFASGRAALAAGDVDRRPRFGWPWPSGSSPGSPSLSSRRVGPHASEPAIALVAGDALPAAGPRDGGAGGLRRGARGVVGRASAGRVDRRRAWAGRGSRPADDGDGRERRRR